MFARAAHTYVGRIVSSGLPSLLCSSATQIHANTAVLRALSHSVNSVCPGFIESDMTAELNAEVFVCMDPPAICSLNHPSCMPPTDHRGACVVGGHSIACLWRHVVSRLVCIPSV